jgi:glycosyltransferase involved in cell wall biosynthesis
MRIISPELGVSPFSNSGGEVYDREILAAYERQGTTVDLILPRNKPYDQIAFKNKPERVIAERIAPPYFFNLLLLPALFRLYRKHPESIVRIHSPYFTGLAILFFRLFHRKVPVVLSYFHVEQFPLFRIIDRFVLPKVDHIFTISNATRKELLSSYHLDDQKMTVAYCGISPHYTPGNKSTELIQRYNLEGKTTLLYLGGLKARKNLLFLLDVLSGIPDPTVVLLFAGSGGERAALEEKAARLGLTDRVRFTGYVQEEEKVPLYRTADIFVFPSALEGFGMVVAEAMACEKPAVVSKVASLPEIIDDGVSGYLVEFNNVAAWQEALKKLIASPELCAKMGKQGRAKVTSTFSWDVAAKKQLDVMQSLTS